MKIANIWILNTFFVFISSMYSQSDPSIAMESSLIPFQFTSVSKPMLHLGAMKGKNDMRFMSGLQFQPTKNLLIGGILSPQKIKTDLSIYYHIVIGYIPHWKFFNISSNMFQIGMHRSRFGSDGDARWFSFSFMESVRFGSLNLNLCWNRLFNQNWDRDTVLISTDLKLSDNFYFRPGAILSFTPNYDSIPFLFVSMNL